MPKSLKKRLLITPDQFNSQRNIEVNNKPYYIPHPNAREAKDSEEKLQKSLLDPSLTETDKVLHYASELHRYLDNIKNAVTVPKASAILGNPTIQVQQPTPSLPSHLTSTPTTHSASRRQHPSPIHTKIPIPTPPITPSSQFLQTPKPKSKRISRLQYSREKIIRDPTLNSSQQQEVKSIIQKLDQNPNFHWNEQTGTVSLDNKPVTNANIRTLILDHLADKPSFNSIKTLKRFRSAFK